MKKSLSIILIIAMLASMLIAAIPAGAARDDDAPVMDKPWETEEGWTAINNAVGLKNMENNKKYYLTGDITLDANNFNSTKLTGVYIHGNGCTITLQDTAICTNAKNLTVRWLNIAGSVNCNNQSARTFCSPFGIYNDDVGIIVFENVNSSVDITYSRSTNRYQSVSGVFHRAEAGSRFVNVNYSGTITFEKNAFVDYVGSLVAQANGTTFTNCEVSGRIRCATVLRTVMVNDNGEYTLQTNGDSYTNDANVEIGNFCGKAKGCTFTDCTNSGYISFKGSSRGAGKKANADHNYGASYAYIGGFVGTMEPLDGVCGVFTNCTNTKDADIILNGNCGGVGNAGGLVGYSKGGSLTMTNCKNDADVTAEVDGVWWLGGIVGMWDRTSSASSAPIQIKLEKCVNKGDIQSYNTGSVNGSYNGQGGIAGYIYNCYDPTDVTSILKDCVNYGNMTSHKSGKANSSMMGGMLGQLIGLPVATFENCVNYGDVIKPETVKSEGFGIGGIVGGARCYGTSWTGTKNSVTTFKNCVNAGKIEGKNAAGIFGSCNTEVTLDASKGVTVDMLQLIFDGCTNAGEIVDPRNTKAAGMVADLGNWTTTITNCANGGSIKSIGTAAGLVATATADAVITVTNGVNLGSVGYVAEGKTTAAAGGLIGSASATATTLTNSLNAGKIVGTAADPIGTATFTDASTGNKYLKSDVYNDDAEEIATLNDALTLAATKCVRACNYIEMYNKANEYIGKGDDYLYESEGATWAAFETLCNTVKGEIEEGMEDVLNYSQADANETYLKFADEADKVRLKPSFTFLTSEITRGEAKLNDGNKYANSSIEKVTTAIETAKALIEKGMAATVEEVAAAEVALTKAIDNMRRITVSTDPDDDENNNDNNNNENQTPDNNEGEGENQTPDNNNGEGENQTPDNTEPENTQPTNTTPAPTTAAPATEESGCGSVIGTAAIAMTAVLALGAGLSLKKKD